MLVHALVKSADLQGNTHKNMAEDTEVYRLNRLYLDYSGSLL